MCSELKRNMPGQAMWEGSFYEALIENAIWNTEAFDQLHTELLDIAKAVKPNEPVNRELATMILFLQQRVSMLVAAHYNIDDVYKISNLSNDDLLDFKEQFDIAIASSITGNESK